MTDRHTCPFRGCRCTHDEPCVAGWIDLTPDADGRDRTSPCPNCRPEVHQHLGKVRRNGNDPDALATARGQLRNLTRAGKGEGW